MINTHVFCFIEVNRIMQIKIIMWYYCTHTIIIKIFKKLGNTGCW